MRLLLSVGVLAFLAGCAKDAPMDYMKPEGPIAEEAHHMFMSIMVTTVYPLGALVLIWMFVAVFRFRHRKGRPEPVGLDRPTKLSYIVAPALLLMVVDLIPLVHESKVAFELAAQPENALEIDVYGHMWWWEYKYKESGVTTANELHIPTGRPVRLTLHSIEPGLPAPTSGEQEFAPGVIHSFWIPKLAGKQDVIPGRANEMTIEADEPGEFLGQCAEYCNLSHANMRLRAVAMEPAEFDTWVKEQLEPAAEPTSGPAKEGFEIFKKTGCMACHEVKGIKGAEARVGPSLTHLASRETFAGATYPLTTANLQKWVADPNSMKPMRPELGTGMPDYNLSDADVAKVVAYLESLK